MRSLISAVLGSIVLLAGRPAADAIDFNFTYEAANSNPPTLNGSVDQNGAVLTSMMNSAASIWSDLIEDNWTINVALRWQVPTLGNNFSGQMSLYQNHPGNTDGDPSEQNSRVVWALIRANPNRTWWVDPTPLDHSEFDMTQSLFQDLPVPQQQLSYSGNVPNLLEIGFRGAPNASAPALMQANGTRDLLTLALHELGHTVGVGGTTAARQEYGVDGAGVGQNDGDYDIDSNFVNGNVFAVRSESLTNGHLHPAGSTKLNLMCVCSLANARILPSAIDIFGAARTANWTDLDLNRQDFLGGNDWNTAGNWEGDSVPLNQDDAWVRNGSHISLSANGRVENLEVSNSSEVSTGANRLTVDDTLTVENDSAGLRPFVRVGAGGELDANDVNVNGGELLLIGGLADIHDDLRMGIANGQRGRLTGHGTVDVAGDFVNNGTIRPSGGTLTISVGANINLDGLPQSSAGIVDATAGNVTFNGELLDAFDGTITIGDDRIVRFNDGWELGANGQLNFEGTNADPATIRGTATTLSGDVNVDGFARLQTDTTVIDGAEIQLAANTASGLLSITGQTTYASGNTFGAGTLRQDGDVTVTGDFSVGSAVYDWDGNTFSTTTITPSGRLSISSSQIDVNNNDGHDGVVNVNGGELSVLAAWRVDGTLRLARTGGSTPVLDGLGGVTIHSTGELITTGQTEINTDVTVNGDVSIGQFGQPSGRADFNGHVEFNDTASVVIEQGSILAINDTASYRGGSHGGNGLLRINGDVSIDDDTSWGVLNLDWDGSNGDSTTSIGLGHTLNISADTVEPTNNGFDGTVNVTSGHLSVQPAWRLDGELNMSQLGPHTGEIQLIQPSLSGDGGLTIHTTGGLNTDGNVHINTEVVVNGAVQSGEGTASFHEAVTFNSSASVGITTFSLGGVSDEHVVSLNGLTTFNGGSYTGFGTIRQVGNASFDAPTTISVARYDADGDESTSLDVNADLTLDVQQIDAPGLTRLSTNRFDGTLLVASGATMTVNTTLPWTLNGTTFLGSAGSAPATIAGSSVNLGNGANAATLNVTGLGQIASDVTFQDDAVVILFGLDDQLDVTGEARFRGGIYTGAGLLALHNDVDVLDDTTIIAAHLDLDGDVSGDHTTTVHANAAFTINSTRINESNNTFGDTLVVQDDALLEINTDSGWFLNSTGVLRFEGDAEAVPGAVLDGRGLTSRGLIEGNGDLRVSVNNQNGTIRPGESAGALRFGRLATTGLIEVELGGTTAASEHDQVTVVNSVNLGGSLDITLIDDFTPDFGDLFAVVTAGTRFGTFDQIHGVLPDGEDFALAPIYDHDGSTGLTLVTALPGDADLNGTVALGDLGSLLDNLGANGSWTDGDFNGDGIVSLGDLGTLLDHLGSSVPSPAPSASFQTVPEPASLALVVIGTVLCLPRRQSVARCP